MDDLDLLKKVINVFDQQKVPYFLDGGTLLGVVRQGSLITGDNDLDIGVTISEYSIQFQDLLTAMKTAGFEPRKNFPQHLASFNIRPKRTSYDHFDIWKFMRYEDRYYWHRGWRGWFDFPLECLDTLTTITVHGYTFSIPSQPEKYLGHLYGKRWREPIQMKKPQGYPNYHTCPPPPTHRRG